MKFADPKNDIAFKKIFGDELHKEVLISFLNAVLDFSENSLIVAVELVNPYQVPKIEGLKETILDIKATNQKGENFIVEMQNDDQGNFAKRSLYYTSKAYVDQIDKGEDYHQLQKVYFIGILDFTIFEKNENHISRHLILNQETQQQDIADFEFTFVELPKFKKKLPELTTLFDKWIYFIKNASNLDMIPEELIETPEIKQAFSSAEIYHWNEKEMQVYDYMSLRRGAELDALRTAAAKGMRKGIEQGMERGIEQGIEQGIQQGIEQDKKEMILKSHQEGVDEALIARITGVDLETVQKIIRSY